MVWFSFLTIGIILISAGLLAGLFLLKSAVGLWTVEVDQHALYRIFCVATSGGIVLLAIAQYF